MTRTLLVAGLAGLATCAALGAAQGTTVDSEANLNFTLTAPSYSGCSDPAYDWLLASDCQDLASAPADGASFLWILVSREGGFTGGGISGAEFGIEYQGLDVVGWTLCNGGQEIPESGWPASGTGQAVTWPSGCFMTDHAARIGYFMIADGDAGAATLTPDPRVGEALWGDCDATLSALCDANLGSAVLEVGIDPVCGDHCGVVPIEEWSWGAIKDLYR